MFDDNKPNRLAHYRMRRGLTQEQVARLLGWKNVKAISRMEAGTAFPTLHTALKLSNIYRVPVEGLYQELHLQIREEIRKHEQAAESFGKQQILPLKFHSDEPPPDSEISEEPVGQTDCDESLNI